VLTKCDRQAAVGIQVPTIATSAVCGLGLAELRRTIAARLGSRLAGPCAVASTAARCRESVELAAASLFRAQRIAEQRGGEELAAAEVRVALDEIGKITGAVYTEDVLDRIFSRFCIGK
jgi:tRNA modification GTPase